MIYEHNWMPINGKPVDISPSISHHLHEKRLEQNAGTNDSDINSSTANTHGHCGTNAPPHTHTHTHTDPAMSIQRLLQPQFLTHLNSRQLSRTVLGI